MNNLQLTVVFWVAVCASVIVIFIGVFVITVMTHRHLEFIRRKVGK